MDENKNVNNTIKSLRDRFKMNPPEDAWTKLDADLERQRAMQYKQRGNRFKLLSLCLAVLLISIVAYNYLMTDHSTLLSDSTKIKSSRKSNGNLNSDTIIGTEQNGWGIQPNNADSNNNSLKNDKKENNKDVSDNSLNKNSSPDKTSFNKPQVAGGNNQTSLSVDKSIKRDSPIKNVNKEEKSNSRKDDKKLTDSQLISNESKEDDKAAIRSETTAKASENLSSETVSHDALKVDLNENNPSPSDQTVKDAPPVSSEYKSSEAFLNTGDSIQAKLLKDSILNIEKGKITRWMVSVFYGPNVYAMNHLKILNQQFAAAIYSYTDRSTSNYSFNSGVTGGYNLSKNWSLSTGGIYSTIAYTSTLATIHTSIGSDDLYHYKYRTSCGSIEIPNQPNVILNAKDSLTTTASCAQTIKIVSVPLLVKYKVTKDRISVFVNTGLAANFILEEVAKVNIGSAEYTIINNISGLRKTNYSYIAGAGFEYNLNNGMSIFMEPSFTTSITPLARNSFFYCYPYSFGLNGGLTFHF
jgi:opacity protein-like surface antigen